MISQIQKLFERPAIIDRLWHETQRIQERQEIAKHPKADPATQIEKIARDLKKWYERHDNAESEVEREAAWDRIIALKQREKELQGEQSRACAQIAKPTRRVTRKNVADFVAELGTRLGGDQQQRTSLIQLLVVHHGLKVCLLDSEISVKLSVGPLGFDDFSVIERSVDVESTTELPLGEVDAWMREHEGKVICRICKKPIPVKRHQYWQGLPKVHHKCGLAEASQNRANPGGEFYNGMQAAAKLGIGRTTIGRWIKSGKLKPVKKQSGVWLFSKKSVNLLAARAKNR